MLKRYFSLVRFAHTLFALPFALIGFTLAYTQTGLTFEWRTLLFVLFCMVFARNAAMSFNRYADAEIDVRNARTAQSEVPAGIIRPAKVLVFCTVNAVLFVIVSFFLNPLCFYLSFVALFIVLGYSYTKRFTWLSHLVLGLSLAIAPLGAYIAVTGAFAVAPMLLSALVLCWAGGFDVLYALSDEEFDRTEKLHSIPEKFGRVNAMRISWLLHILAVCMVVFTGYYLCLNLWYWIGALFFIALLIYQHLIIKPADLRRLNAAFFSANGIASLVYCFFTIISLL